MKLADEIKKLMDKPQITEIEHKRAMGILGTLIQEGLANKDMALIVMLNDIKKQLDQKYYTRFVSIEERIGDTEKENELIRLITIASCFADMLNEALTVVKSRARGRGCENIGVVKMAEAALSSTAEMIKCYDETSDLASRMFEYISRNVSERYYPAIENEVRMRMNYKVPAEELGL